MTKKLFVLKEITDFASGAFENTGVENGGIQLGRKAQGHLQSGSYTSPPYSSPAFDNVVPSWNADTPVGTTVEVQVRIGAKGKWSPWFSFGKWSPYIYRASPEPQSEDFAECDAEFLRVIPGRTPADMVQLRVKLETEDDTVSPTVRLLAASVNSDAGHGIDEEFYDRVLTVPAYSSLVRDPSIAGRMGGATSLTMLMNRHGEDVLPEEVARSVYDTGAGKYSNLSFLCAAGGMYGYESYIGYAGTDALRREIWLGNPVGALVHYRAPALSGEEEAPSNSELPIFEGATADSQGHLVVVRGFETREDGNWVYLNDPLQADDVYVPTEIPMATFEEIYMNLCLILHKGRKGAGSAKPYREIADMSLEDGKITLQRHGEQLIPGPFTRTDYSRSTLCYTLSGPTLYSSAAQRKFYYPTPDEHGSLRFDTRGSENRRMTFYRVGPLGRTVVGEKMIFAADVDEDL